jgi:peroxiredoxin
MRPTIDAATLAGMHRCRLNRFWWHSNGVSFAAAWCLVAVACDPAKPATEAREAPVAATSGAPGQTIAGGSTGGSTTPSTGPTPAAAVVSGVAEIGKAAPDFELRDLDGQSHRLSQLRGKTVVLEWFNPQCPFVNAAHNKGSLHGLAEKYTAKGVAWLAINSAAQGRQGFGVEANADGKRRFGLTHPILLDESGAVGHAYHATNTPHMFVIDDKGVLVYRGAIDNSPDGEGESPQGGTLVNYVAVALDDLAAGRAVKTPQTEAYGCSVKYAQH